MSTIKEILYSKKPVYRRNFIQENVRQLRDMQNFHSNKHVALPTIRQNVGQYNFQKPRSKSSDARSRDQSSTTSMQRVDRPITTANSYINIAKKHLDGKATCRNGCDPVILNQARCFAAKNQVPIERVVGQKSENHRIERQNNNVNKSAGSRRAITRRDPNIQATDTTKATTVHPTTKYKDGSSQTLNTQDVDELYKEGVIVYSSTSLVTNDRLALSDPIRLDSASQTDRIHSPVDMCARQQDLQTYGNNVDYFNIREVNIDDCKENRQEHCNGIISSSSRRSSAKQKCSTPSDSLKAPAAYQKGVVPRYLRERQQEWQRVAEEERANAPDPSCPPGHVLLPEEERKQTLDMIRKDYANLVRELNMMPVRTDTLRLRQKKIELEQKLTKLEDATKVFSRPKVFVKVGE